jgi:hypothetical protein
MKHHDALTLTTPARLLLAAALSISTHATTMHAQVREERRPTVTDKALITKDVPRGKEKAGKAEARKPVKQYSIEQFMATTKVGGASFTHDEKEVLFHSNKSGIYNVYSIPVSGGEPKQLTNSTKESTYLVSAFRVMRVFSTPTTKVETRTRTCICASLMAPSAT